MPTLTVRTQALRPADYAGPRSASYSSLLRTWTLMMQVPKYRPEKEALLYLDK